MDTELKRRISDAVLEILGSADMEEATEFKVRSAAAGRLGIDLSLPERKRFVRSVVESFLRSKQAEAGDAIAAAAQHQAQDDQQQQEQQQQRGDREEEEEEEEEEDAAKGGDEKEYDDDGDLILCRLSTKRRVTLQEFRGKTLVSIREYYEKDGKQLPTSKGISLTTEQWEAFRDGIPAIEDAIKKIESRLE